MAEPCRQSERRRVGGVAADAAAWPAARARTTGRSSARDCRTGPARASARPRAASRRSAAAGWTAGRGCRRSRRQRAWRGRRRRARLVASLPLSPSVPMRQAGGEGALERVAAQTGRARRNWRRPPAPRRRDSSRSAAAARGRARRRGPGRRSGGAGAGRGGPAPAVRQPPPTPLWPAGHLPLKGGDQPSRRFRNRSVA